MKSFFEFLNEIAVDNMAFFSNQPVSGLIQRNFPMGALNYDFSNLPPTNKKKKNKHQKFYKLEHEESKILKVSDIAEVNTNFPEADFWLKRKGSIKEVGKPTKDFDKEKIGIKIKSDKIDKNYLYYVFEYLNSIGFFAKYATGTLNLVNIKISTVKNIELKLND